MYQVVWQDHKFKRSDSDRVLSEHATYSEALEEGARLIEQMPGPFIYVTPCPDIIA